MTRYRIIQQLRAEYPVRRLCDVLEASPSGYYEWRRRTPSSRQREDRRLRAHIRAVFQQRHGRYGSPRIYKELRRDGNRCSRKRVARLMCEQGLRARPRRRFRVTTQSAPGRQTAPNVLARCFAIDSLDSAWLGDITYLWTDEGWLYLAVLMDLCSRRIIAWAVSDTITDDLTLQALNQALRARQHAPGLVHHTDRGSQYNSDDYQRKLRELDFTISMSRKGDCWDNAPIESFFSSLKLELGDRFSSRAAARTCLFEYIEVFYNRVRMHSSLGDQSPAEFEDRIRRTSRSRAATAMEADAAVEIAPRFPPPRGQRFALPTASTAATTAGVP